LDERPDKLRQSWVERRFTQEEQRDYHQQANMRTDQRKGKQLVGNAPDERQRHEDGPQKHAERQPQLDRICFPADETQAATQPV
jgi:hypothetical protein